MANIIKLEQIKALAEPFTEMLGIKDKENFVQNVYMLAQDPSTQQYELSDVMKQMLKAEKFGVSLVKKEAYLYPMSVKKDNAYVTVPTLVVDYKFETQQILQNGDCQQFSVNAVFKSDKIERSEIGHTWTPSSDLEGEVVGYYGFYKGKSNVIGKYMSKEEILSKLPDNNKNALYKGSDSKSEWLFKKMIIRQMKKLIPLKNTANFDELEKVEYVDTQTGEIVNKAAAKLPPAPEPEPEDNTPY